MVEDIEDSNYDENIQSDKSIEKILNECQRNDFPDSVMAFNLAKLIDEERSRLVCRRLGYCNADLLPRMYADEDCGEMLNLVGLNEDNAIMDQAKFKKRPHGRMDPELS